MKRTIDKRKMPRDEWLRHIQRFIGGSNAAAIFGVDKYSTRLEVYLQKTAPEPIQIPDNNYMWLGRVMEPAIAKRYSEMTGWKVVQDHKIRLHPKYDFIGGDIDRIIISPEHETPGIMEIKMVGQRVMAEWDGDIPLSYRLQPHHYMLIHPTARWAVIVVMVRETGEMLTYPVEYNPELAESMTEEYCDFWQNYIEKRIPPCPETRADILKLFPDSQPVTVEAQESDIKAHGRLEEINNQLKSLESEQDAIKLEIQKRMLSAELMAEGDKKLFTWKSQERKEFCEQKFKKHHSKLWAKYYQPKTIRVFLTK
uniref:Putative exonuclease n=1 Tax=viral metagenome TaxID=1070528 RepID=A0A6M3XNE7_9ZZZZ